MSAKEKADAANEPESKRSGGINARVVFHAIRRRPLGMLGVVLLGGAVASGVWFFLPLPKATAAVVFHVASRAPSLLAGSADGQASFASYRQSQAALVKRRVTLSRVLKQPEVSGLEVIQKAQPDPINWLDQKLKVDTRTNSEFMQVSLEGDNGDELQIILGAVAKEYLADVDERDNGERRRRLAKLEDTHRAYQAELERFNKRIDAIAFALGSKDGPTLAALDSLYQEDLRVAVRELSNAREQQQLAELELAALDAPANPTAPAPAIPAALIDAELRKDPVLRDLDAAVTRAREALAETEKLFQAGSTPPAVTRAREQVKAAEGQRDQYQTDRRPQVEAQLREAFKRADQLRQDELRRTLERLKQKVEVAKGKVDEVQQRIGKANQYRIELENIKRQIEQTEKLTRRLAEEIEILKVELGAPPRVTMSEEPFVVPGIEGNRRLKYTLLAGVVTFGLGFAGLVGWEYRSRRVTHTDEVTADIGVQLLGVVPPISGRDRSAVPDQALVEAIDTTRTMLLHGTPVGTGLRTVVVTSAVAGEGKTSLSGHLAISLARAGFRTLLVDADLQSPSAQRLFDLPEGPGLCDLLRGQATVRDAVQPSRLPGLSILPAGHWDLAARQGIVGEQWRLIKRELESQFDFLVVDTAPLLLVSDTMLLAREADGVVLSVLLGVSQVAHVAESAERLQALGVNVAGAVVNGVWHKAYRNGYGYGYGSTTTTRGPGVAV